MRSRIIVVILFALCSRTAVAHIPHHMRNQITHMIKSNLPDASVGVIVQDAKTGEIIYDYHGAKHFLPASTTKLFTAAAALKALGANYQYNTSLFYNPNTLSNGIHSGDIAVQFTGDPSLSLKNLYSLLQTLAAAKITTIEGNLIIDDTIFAGPMFALGWTWDSTAWHHAAPVSAIIIDRNQFGITLFPSDKEGGKVTATLDKEYFASSFRSMRVDVRAVTFEDSENLCQLTTIVDEKNNLELGGCWPIGTQPTHLRVAIKNPRYQAEQLITAGLQQLNIKLTGSVKFAKTPTNLTRLAYHASEPLSALLKPILAESNNLYAESLTKTLGAKLYGIGSFKTGSAAVQNVLTETTGIDFKQTRMLDGSGESRYNLFSPRDLARLLYSMRKDQPLADHFRNALAMSGMSGSLQNRFTKLSPHVQAKTGTLNGVSTLAGYFTSHTNRELIVAIMINHALEGSAFLKQFEEELCYFIVEQL